MISALIIASGSKGNATLIYNEDTSLLIDYGISEKYLNEKLIEFGKNPANLNYFLFTHAHTDHIKSYESVNINKRYSLKNVVPLKEENVLKYFEEYKFGSFLVTPIKASHDANPTCGYLIKSGDEDLIYLTDTGKIVKRTLSLMKNRTYYIIESNHDINMLLNSDRSDILKNRILSYRGHLSNEDSAFYISSCVGVKTKKIVLAHLSEECNTPELALKTYHNIFALKGVNLDKIEIKCAKQYEAIELWLRLKSLLLGL